MMHSPLQLSRQYPQKRAFITGAASGLGEALALQLASEGWQIGITDINEADLQKVAAKISQKGGKPLVYIFDVSDHIEYAHVADDFLEKAGGIDILFNNAGVGDGGKLGEYSLENWAWMIGINQMGVIYGCHYFVPAMKAQKSGCIISTASAAAIANAPQMGAYNVTKAAVLSLSETLKTELYEDNIKVCCVMPWFFKTNIIQHARGSEKTKRMGQKSIEEATLSADEVAQIILREAGKGKFHIIITRQAKRMWWIKRLFPSYFFKIIRKFVLKKEQELERDLAKENKAGLSVLEKNK